MNLLIPIALSQMTVNVHGASCFIRYRSWEMIWYELLSFYEL